MKKRNPWSWIPTLYFAEGVPNVLVTVVAVIMYMQLGMTDTELALYQLAQSSVDYQAPVEPVRGSV